MVNAVKRVLVFDSGVGGLSVLDSLRASPHALVLDYFADNAWLPYGLKPDAALRARVPALLEHVAGQWGPDAVVLACNTASTIVLPDLRARLTMPVIGVVPPIKPAAAQTATGTIGLLATPATVRRPYTEELIARFASDKRVVRFGSAALVQAAERKLRGGSVDNEAVLEAIAGLFGAEGGGEIDVVALACTHFPLLATELAGASPRVVTWLDSGAAIARRAVEVLAPDHGTPRFERAAFTDAANASDLYGAFRARGCSKFFATNEARGFEIVEIVA
jgi:glutamate racemase